MEFIKMYKKYDNHHKILVFIKQEKDFQINKKDNLKKDKNTVIYIEGKGEPTSEEISKGLGVDLLVINEAIIDLYDLGFLNRNDFKYSLKEHTITYIESNYFKNKKYKYKKNAFLKDLKDVFIILVALATLIYPFIIPKKQDKPNETQSLTYQEQLKNKQKEQTNQLKISKTLLKDSLYAFEKKLKIK